MANCCCNECENRGSCDSYGAGIADSEKRIIEWLREKYAQRFGLVDGERCIIAAHIGAGEYADAIERGEHRE